MHLKTEDPQEIFAEAIEYFKAALSRCARSNSGICLYLNDLGQRCVAGHFIVADSDDDLVILRTYMGAFLSLNNQFKITDNPQAERLLSQFQSVHDPSTNWDMYSGKLNYRGWDTLRTIGSEWGFDVSEIDKITGEPSAPTY